MASIVTIGYECNCGYQHCFPDSSPTITKGCLYGGFGFVRWTCLDFQTASVCKHLEQTAAAGQLLLVAMFIGKTWENPNRVTVENLGNLIPSSDMAEAVGEHIAVQHPPRKKK